jgi:hypothetical protein
MKKMGPLLPIALQVDGPSSSVCPFSGNGPADPSADLCSSSGTEVEFATDTSFS